MVYYDCKQNLATKITMFAINFQGETKMNKEEILAKSRAENKMADEMELQIRLKAGKIAKVCGVVVAFILAFIGEIFGISVIGWTATTIAFVMISIESLVVIIKTKNKSEWFIVATNIVFMFFSIAMLIKSVL